MLLIHIDGSYGEGGGQILRTAVALSIIRQTPVSIENIRAKRPKPGMKPQHFTAVSILKDLSSAETTGLSIGSKTLEFTPQTVPGGVYKFDVGTAGSIVLIFQACLPLSLVSQSPISITLTGGTDVNWSPSWDFFTEVYLRAIRRMGVSLKAELHRRGYYPKGDGKATIHFHPINHLKSYQGSNAIDSNTVFGRVHVANLPDHIGRRMKHAAMKRCTKEGLPAQIRTDLCSSASAGTGISLWMFDDHSVIGVSCLGQKGVPAETIGTQAMVTILKDFHAGASIDEHLFDQVLPFLVFSNNPSICRVRTISEHARTNLWLIQQFIDGDFYRIEEKQGYSMVYINE